MKKHRKLPVPVLVLFILFSLVFVDYALNLTLRLNNPVTKALSLFTRPIVEGLQQLENRYYDLQTRWRFGGTLSDDLRDLKLDVQRKDFELFSPEYNRRHDEIMQKNLASQDIAIVAIDEKTLTELDQWPLRRDAYVKMIRRILEEGGARGIVFDVGFFEKGDQALLETVASLNQSLPESQHGLVRDLLDKVNFNKKLEEAFLEYRTQIVAGSILFKEEQTKTQDKDGLIFPYSARRYHGVDPNLLDHLSKIYVNGTFSYDELREHVMYNAFFTVSPDADGIVRHMGLLAAIPVQLKSDDGGIEKERMVFSSLGLEAYNMTMEGGIQSPRLDTKQNVITMDATPVFHKLNDESMEKLRQAVQSLLEGIPGISAEKRKALKEITSRASLRLLPVHDGLSQHLFLWQIGDYELMEEPGFGFYAQLATMPRALFEDFVASLPEKDRAAILKASSEEDFRKLAQELAPLAQNPGKRFLEMLAQSLWYTIGHRLSPLHAFSMEERANLKKAFLDQAPKLELHARQLFTEKNLAKEPHIIRMEPDGKIGITFKGPKQSYIQYSMADVIFRDRFRGKLMDFPTNEMNLREAFEGRIVFLGPTASGINDWRPTPIAEYMDGVELHCHTLDSLRDGTQILRPESGGHLSVLEIFGMLGTLVFLPMLILRLNAIFGALLSMSMGFGWLYFCHFMFHNGNLYYQATPMAASILFVYIFLTTHEYIMEEKEKAKTRDAFSRYVNKSVVDSVLNDPDMLKLEGQRREMTVLFSDVRGFTTISEKLEPEVLVEVMNTYLTEMTNILLDYDGTLDKFIGDAVMAFWGAPLNQPNHAELATKTAIDMNKEVEILAKKIMDKYGVEIAIGIGLNTGPMIVGNVGSSERFNYTVLGDAVNLGARLEGQTKNYGAYLILNETTYEIVKDWVAGRFLDLIAVKGKALPVKIYEVTGYRKEASAEYLEGMAAFDRAVEEYYYPGRKFAEGIEAFENLKKYRGGKDKACDLYIERCREFAANPPPEDWTGAFVATSK